MEDKKTTNKIVKTYAEDMASVISEDRQGLIKKIIHGEEEHEKEKMNLSPQSKKNKAYIFLGVLFILLGIGTLTFFFLQKDAPSMYVELPYPPIIFSDKSESIEVKDFTKDQIVERVRAEIIYTKVKQGGVSTIYLTELEQIIGLRRFVALIKGTFSPSGNFDFVNDHFVLGVINNAEEPTRENPNPVLGKDFFLILKMREMSDIFNALRAWENKMFADLHGFVGYEISPETNYLLTKNFEDEIFENKNARVLTDKDGGVVLMYVYANENSVVITHTKEAAHELMLRLSASRIKK